MRIVVLLTLALAFLTCNVNAQATFEMFPGAGNTTGNGPASNSQTIIFQSNSNNPFDNNATASDPVITVSYSLSNQQFSSIEGNPGTPGTVFGGSISAANSPMSSAPVYSLMNYISSSVNNNYTACNTCSAGTGMDINSNAAINIFNSTDALISSTGVQNFLLDARVQYSDITISFSQPVTNPVMQITGMGGYMTYSTNDNVNYTQGWSTEFDMLTSGLNFVKLSGSTYLNVQSQTINNTATYYGSVTTGAAIGGVTRYAASGSVAIIGTMSSFTLRMYIRGDGGIITKNDGTPTASTHGNIVRWAVHQSYIPNNGSALAQYISGDNILMGFSLENGISLLPVVLNSFTINNNDKKCDLNWTTGSGINAILFVVERSADGNHFFKIAEIPVADNKTGALYNYSDDLPLPGLNYYRLKLTDADGNSTYSVVKSVIADVAGLAPIISPNPFNDAFTIRFSLKRQTTADIILSDASGKIVYKKTVIGIRGQNIVPVNNLFKLLKGIYFVSINADGNTYQQKIVKEL